MMLTVLTREDAVALIKEKTSGSRPATEKVCISHSLGRTLARDVTSHEDIPSFDRTTVDGYAVRAADTFGAGESLPSQLEIAGEILMGENASVRLERGQCVRISTGGMLPQGADAAVMVENTDSSQGLCLVYRSVAPYENVTKTGEDIRRGDTVLKKGTTVGPAEIGVFAALGINEVEVYKKPVVAVISTGDEIVSGDPKPGQIRDINTPLLCAALEKQGCGILRFGVVPDKSAELESAVKDCARKADAVLISGGSSAGARDMTVSVIDSLGRTFFHGISIKPGKPTIFGMVGGKPVFGLPGHPLAAYFVFRLIVTEYIRTILDMPPEKPYGEGVLALNIPSNHGREEFLCVKSDESGLIYPLHTKSGIISVLSQAEGFITIPRNSEGLDKGTVMEVYRL
ncbi:MAG: molybdopterin molybdenumtransferase MoeA [Clostridia bacterium]|nr:molybdopterin molybdenumtransferase MoeA [Clostridia bacterium]